MGTICLDGDNLLDVQLLEDITPKDAQAWFRLPFHELEGLENRRASSRERGRGPAGEISPGPEEKIFRPRLTSVSEVILQCQLEEPGIGSEVPHGPITGNLAALGPGAGVIWGSPRRGVEQIETIRAELQVLLFKGVKILCGRQVNSFKPRAGDLRTRATEVGQDIRSSADWRSYRARLRRIRKGAGVVPIG